MKDPEVFMFEEHEEKHLQLGTNLDDDDRTPVEDLDEVWVDACTVEEFKAGIEELRESGWPVGE